MEIIKDIKKLIEEYKSKMNDCDTLIEEYTIKGKAIAKNGGDSSLYYSNMKHQETKRQTLLQAQKDFESLLISHEDDLVKEHKIMNDGLNANPVILTFNEVENMSDEEIIFFNKKTSMFAKWKNIKALELFEERICKINKSKSKNNMQ